MGLQIPPGYGIATMHLHYNTLAKDMSITHGFRDDTSSNDPVAAATAWRAMMASTGCPFAAVAMSTAWVFNGVSILMKTSSNFLVTGQNLTPIAGTGTPPAADEPVFAPYVVTKFTPFAGRAFRGRCYVPMMLLGENIVDAGGSLTPSSQTTLQGQWNQFLTNANASNYTPRLLHTDVGVSTPTPNSIVSYLVRPVVGMQRRRRTRGA